MFESTSHILKEYGVIRRYLDLLQLMLHFRNVETPPEAQTKKVIHSFNVFRKYFSEVICFET